MKVCLAGTSSSNYLLEDIKKSKYLLESYYSIKDWQVPLIKSSDLFILDSGAFTFMNTGTKVNFNDFLSRYIEFINKYDVKYFFELDIDSIVGLSKVENMRYRLERETRKKCIPVFHKSRGKDYYQQMIKEYEYVAIGGIAIKNIKRNEYKYFKWFIEEAHKQNCKVHGLGMTSIKELYKYKFDSVDSTSWLSGGRFGSIYQYQNGNLKSISFKNRRTTDYRKVNKHNFNEWVKFQKFAELHL